MGSLFTFHAGGSEMNEVFIGLPVYNGDAYLEGAIKTIQAQTYPHYKLLISDNASTDSTEKIGLKYAESDPRIEYFRHEKNMGAAPNFNFCVEQATGKYFKWMSHDDLCKPTYLEKCVAILEADAEIALCHSYVQMIDELGEFSGLYTKEREFDDSDPVVRFAKAMALDHGCVSVFGVIRLELLQKTPAIAPFVGSDRSLLAELALAGKLANVPEELFMWRDHKNRSVKIDRKTRAAWFDANAQGIFSTLYLRQFLANNGAILRSDKPLFDKLRAFMKTSQWLVQNRGKIFRDMRATAGAALKYRSN